MDPSLSDPSTLAVPPRGDGVHNPSTGLPVQGSSYVNEGQPFINTIATNVLQDIYDSIRTAPTGAARVAGEERQTPFFFYSDENNKLVVTVPRNIEAFADCPVIKAFVAAIYVDPTNVTVVPSSKDLGPEELKWVTGYDDYFLGLAAALKQKGDIQHERVSGPYAQGYHWICTQTSQIQKHKGFFRTIWKNPYFAFLGRETWVGDASKLVKRFYDFVLIAARKCKLRNVKDFAKSYEELSKELLRNQFHYESGAVFIQEEIDLMKNFIQPKRDSFEELRKLLKDPTAENILAFESTKQDKSRDLLAYDARIETIVSKRAAVIYSQKSKKKLSKKGAHPLTDRLYSLDPSDLISATNPTGLLTGHTVEFHSPARASSEELLEQFTKWFEANLTSFDSRSSDLIIRWARWIERRLKADLD